MARREEGAGARSLPGLEGLQRDLEELGLNGSEARVVVALLQVQQATGTELARLSGVPRTAVYPVLDQLRTKGVIDSIPGKATLWASPGPDVILERLYRLQQKRIEALDATMDRARRAVAEMALDEPTVAFSSLQVLRGLSQTNNLYLRLLDAAQSEVLVCNKGPYGRLVVEPAVLDMVARGVQARALFESSELDDPELESLHEVAAAYSEAGVDSRVVDLVPMVFAVFDRTDVLFTLMDPVLPIAVSSMSVHVSDTGFAAVQADAFEQAWSKARPLPARPRPSGLSTSVIDRAGATEAAEV